MKTRKIPMRKCIGCMESMPKKDLIRIVAVRNGEDDTDVEIVLDSTGRAPGRGAYICPKRECFNMAIKKRAISRSLSVELTQDNINRLSEELEKYEK